MNTLLRVIAFGSVSGVLGKIKSEWDCDAYATILRGG
jgi:hypothetical protein